MGFFRRMLFGIAPTWVLLIALAISLLMVVWGCILYRAVKPNDVPPWLSWWSPVTYRLPLVDIGKCDRLADRFRIDGISFIVSGFGLFAWFVALCLFVHFGRKLSQGWFVLFVFLSLAVVIRAVGYLTAALLRSRGILPK